MGTCGDPGRPLLGVMAEFDTEAELFRAAEQLRGSPYQRYDFFSPYPVDGLAQYLPSTGSPLGPIVFAGGLAGFLLAAAMVYWPSAIWYPVIVAGKPPGFFSGPAFVPILFEFTILFGAFAAFLGLLVCARLPRWHHPVFAWERFDLVTSDRFFAVVEARDPQFVAAEVEEMFRAAGARQVVQLHEE